MAGPAPQRSANLTLVVLALVITAARLWPAASAGLGDAEAYYWTWSRHLAAGYYDHGPVVALLIRLGTTLLGHSPLGVRLVFVLLSGLQLWLVAAAARRLPDAPPSSGLWAMGALLAIPAFQVAGAAANPDVPFMALVSGFILLCLGPTTVRRVAAGGLLAGLAVSTKLTGLALLLPLVAFCRRADRRVAGTLAGIAALLLGALPVLLWNVRHAGASLAYHLVHRHSEPIGPSLLNLAKLVGGQLAYISPLVLLGLGAAAAVALRRRTERPFGMLLWTALALLGSGYLLIVIVPGAEPHWPAAGYLALLPVLAAVLPAWIRRRWVRGLTLAAIVFSALVGLALHLHVLTDLGVRLMPASYEPRYDLSNELCGWDRVASAVAREIAHSQARTLAVGSHYTSCAQLAFAARGRFAVRCPSPRLDQHDFFPGGDGSSLRGVDLVYVKDPRFPFEAAALYRCADLEQLPAVEIRRAGRLVRRFELERCRGFAGLASDRWPPR